MALEVAKHPTTVCHGFIQIHCQPTVLCGVSKPAHVSHASLFVVTQNIEHWLVGGGASLCRERAILTALSASGPLAAVPPHMFVLATCTVKLGFYCIFVFLVIVFICWAGVGVALEHIRRPTEVHDDEWVFKCRVGCLAALVRPLPVAQHM